MTIIVLSIALIIVSVVLIVVCISSFTYRRKVNKSFDLYHNFLEESWEECLYRLDISGAHAYNEAISRAEFEFIRLRLGLSNENKNKS